MSSRRVALSLLVIIVAFGALLAAILALIIGVWIGGRHGDLVPQPLRSALVGSNDQIIVNEALDVIDDTYYRKLAPGQLADTAIAGAVKKLNDRFSTYFTPAEYKSLKRRRPAASPGSA